MGGVSVKLLFKSDAHEEREGKEEQAGITDKKMTLTVYCREKRKRLRLQAGSNFNISLF